VSQGTGIFAPLLSLAPAPIASARRRQGSRPPDRTENISRCRSLQRQPAPQPPHDTITRLSSRRFYS
jgi:hypothetical protein